MFYSMIQPARDKWFSSAECKVQELLQYIEKTGFLRDAQTDAIKTYLFLKLGCGNLPLHELFCTGKFNTLTKDDIDVLPLSALARDTLLQNPAALALYEYATRTNEKGEQVSKPLEEAIESYPDKIDYKGIFKKIFYNVSYPDYLFSLPMGAGKTFLMASFIYLDLYFALQEPENPAFSHNFVILAPSGLKTSVVPSLRTIQQFNPAWILSEPTASEIKGMISLEVLDAEKSAKKSNKAKNPNVQKLAAHQPIDSCFALVAVTNAEKVILDGLVKGEQDLFEDSDDTKGKEANELRCWIGKLPNLSVYIDEVHHATDSDIKLRSVVNRWAENKTVTGVLGFSGTPYLDSAEKIRITENLSIRSADISNTVFYYPLVSAIGNFLKYPVVKISSAKNSLDIIGEGTRAFLEKYKDKTYGMGGRELAAKLAVYCGKGIDFLEDEVYPLVSGIVQEYGMSADEVVLRYHGGNKKHPVPADSEYQFKILDRAESKKKIVLLCQIGKEGWDCRSLAGVILSQEGDCPTNMVLQTSCRCLRQVEKNKKEDALIYLNESNYEKLRRQLEQQQHINIEQFQKGTEAKTAAVRRYDRTKILKLPAVALWQLSIKYSTVVTKEPDTEKGIAHAADDAETGNVIKREFDMKTGSETQISVESADSYMRDFKAPANFNLWILTISKESFCMISIEELEKYEKQLRDVFDKITFAEDGEKYFSPKFNIAKVNGNIRKAFCAVRDLKATEEMIQENASLLKIENFTSMVTVPEQNLESYFPEKSDVEKINAADNGALVIFEEKKQAVQALRSIGKNEMADSLENECSLKYPKDRSFHYMPYKTDSRFEITFLEEILKEKIFLDLNLEVFYNGDNELTNFKIKCYQKLSDGGWSEVGSYTPDFLIVQRNKENEIHKAIIVETKGSLYANDPAFVLRKKYVEDFFVPMNEKKFSYKKFDYLYLEDSLKDDERIEKTVEKIKEFFEPGK